MSCPHCALWDNLSTPLLPPLQVSAIVMVYCYCLSHTQVWLCVVIYLPVYTRPCSDGRCISCVANRCFPNREVAECPLLDKVCNINTFNMVEGCFACLSLLFSFSFRKWHTEGSCVLYMHTAPSSSSSSSLYPARRDASCHMVAAAPGLAIPLI